MCDTMYKKIGENSAIFLKNSDRAANEPNLIILYPERKGGGTIDCTYISVPDEGACKVLLYKPSWIWGAEMGINEYGVSIGNEAVWTKSRGKKDEKLLGMDILRLALERGRTAFEASQIIISLLETYGQGGNAGFDHSFYYDNSYLIADAGEAYVLETAGKHWAWKKVIGQANISNRLSICDDYDRCSMDGDFCKQNIEPVVSFFSGSAKRKYSGECSISALNQPLELQQAFNALRAHHNNADDDKLFDRGSVKSVCMHAGGLFGDHTTGSMAVWYLDGNPYIWVTGSSTPCLSVFKPVSLDIPFAPVFPEGREEDALKYWLEREKVLRAVYGRDIDAADFREKAMAMEKEFVSNAEELITKKASIEAYAEFCTVCAKKESEFIAEFSAAATRGSGERLPKFWAKKNQTLGKNVFERSLSKRAAKE